MDINIAAIVGLYGGMLAGLWGWWYGRKKAREERGLDELYVYIWKDAKSYSWYCTLVAIYILFSLLVFGIEINAAAILGILLMVHLSSWAISGIILTIRFSGKDEHN